MFADLLSIASGRAWTTCGVRLLLAAAVLGSKAASMGTMKVLMKTKFSMKARLQKQSMSKAAFSYGCTDYHAFRVEMVVKLFSQLVDVVNFELVLQAFTNGK